MKTSVPVSAVWLRTAHSKYPHMKKLEVLAEVNGEWRLLFTEHVPQFAAEVSHIAEAGLIAGAPPDPITVGAAAERAAGG